MEPRQRGSAEQFAVFIEYMERHGDLAKPELGAQDRRRSTEKWQELATVINSIGGGMVKPVDKWKKVWADWKTKTKKKYLDNRQHASGTGGGPGSRHQLTTLEKRVVSVLGRSAVRGIPVPRERGFNTAPPLANHVVEVSNFQVASSPAPAVHLPTSAPLPSPPPPPSSLLPQPSSSHLPPPPLLAISLPLQSPPPAKRGGQLPGLADREVEKMASPRKTAHPAEEVELSYGCLVDEDQYTHHNTMALRIFTDGSKIEGRVGAALSLWNSAAETKALKFALSPYCTVYQAELLALNMAAKEALKGRENTVGIFSDSTAALQTIINNSSPHPLALETRNILRRCKLQNKEISLFWIKAHAGLEGNERADKLAKEAALCFKRRPVYDLCPISYVKRQIRIESAREWSRRYEEGETASVTKLFFPDTIEAFKIIKNIKIDGILTQVMTGHGGFSGYLNRFKRKENPSCLCAPENVESVCHLFLECETFEYKRKKLEEEIETILTKDKICEIVKNKNTRDTFINYCKQIVNNSRLLTKGIKQCLLSRVTI